MEQAYFAAGCFWGVEAAFRKLDGVTATAVGYMGGGIDNPTYEQVCTDRTGHAEAVEVTYDPDIISYQKLLSVFWENHNPTTLNRQGPDVGSQYRSGIFTTTAAQSEMANTSKRELEKSGKYKMIVTEILPADKFFKAEDYHQQYFEKRGIDHCGI